MNEFMTPPLLITEYYDSLISQLDIYVEERIKEIKENGLQLDRIYTFNTCGTMVSHDYDKYGIKTLKNPYEKQNYRIKTTKIPKIEINDISEAEEYMNKVRQKAIDEIRKVKEETLKFYKANKEEFKVDRKNLTEEKLEELKSQLFSNRFCFLVKKQPVYTTIFELHIVITDFYLRESEIDYIRNEADEEYEIKHKPTKLDKRFLLANQAQKYIDKIIDMDINGYEIINIKKKNLFEIKHIKVSHYNNDDLIFKETDLSFDTDINLSSIKSLNLQVDAKISDLSAFVNLEYLFIYRIKLCQSPFQNLKKLIKLEIYESDLSEFDFDSLNSLTSLQIICIYINIAVKFKIDLNRLINLKWIDLGFNKQHDENNLELITDGSYNQLTYVKVNKTSIDFTKQLDLPELKYLDICNVDLSQQINQHIFNGMSNLIELNLNNTNLKNVDFLDTDRLGNLEKLNLSNNQIKELRKGAFLKLKNLEKLDLNSNQIPELIPGVFEGLERLKNVCLLYNNINVESIDKTVFDGLKCLKYLNIRGYQMRDLNIDH